MSTDELREEVRRLCSLVENLERHPCKFDCRKGVRDTWIKGYIEGLCNVTQADFVNSHDAWTKWNDKENSNETDSV